RELYIPCQLVAVQLTAVACRTKSNTSTPRAPGGYGFCRREPVLPRFRTLLADGQRSYQHVLLPKQKMAPPRHPRRIRLTGRSGQDRADRAPRFGVRGKFYRPCPNREARPVSSGGRSEQL